MSAPLPISSPPQRLRGAVERAVAYVQGAPLPPADWLADGWPRAFVLPLLVALPFMLSGLVRTTFGWSLGWSLVPALLLSLPAAWPFVLSWRAARGRDRGGAWATIVPLVVAAASVLLLYNRAFAGLTNYAGADGGVHAYYAPRFANEVPEAYERFISMYAVMYWIERIGRTHVFWAFCGVFYAGVVVVAVVPHLVASAALASAARTRVAAAAGRVAAAVTLAATAWFVILPQQNYHQTDGFFVHLFGLVPLFTLWLVDATTNARLWRWLWIAAGAIVYRYTYGLNLADLALALSALAVVDSFAPGVPAWLRWPLRATPIFAFFAARFFFRQLAPLMASYGWIVAYKLDVVLAAQALVALALVVVVVAVVMRSRAAVAARALRFPLAFVAANWAGTRYLQHLKPAQPYYLLKYPIHGVVLGAAALVVVVAVAAVFIVDALATKPRKLGACVVGAVGVVALALATYDVQQWRVGFASFWPLFAERVFRQAPYHNVRPLADLAAWPRIEQVLERQHKQFGGYLTSYWPMFNFMNAAFGYYNGGRHYWEHGFTKNEPGYCVFWDRGKVDWWSGRNDFTPVLSLNVSQLEQRGPQECMGYRAHWNRSIERTLCYVCQ
ncbi:MAG TPA: hypothetical protein VIA18_05470 [Polyangia bacterium]|nr:hypothetical protein [Polyangia bacterium]